MWRTAIFDLAEARGWSRPELAAALGVHETTVWRWQQKGMQPSAAVMWRAAEVFGRPVAELFWQLPEHRDCRDRSA